MALILFTCEERPQLFLRELRDLLREHGVQTSISGLARFFMRHGISRKRGRSMRPSRVECGFGVRPSQAA